MEISPKPENELRSKIGAIATAIAFAFVIWSVAAGPARADEHQRGNDDRNRHQDSRDYGERGHDVYVAPQPDYYYAPPTPNYYYAPEPDYYYAPQPPPPPEGIQLFFGF